MPIMASSRITGLLRSISTSYFKDLWGTSEKHKERIHFTVILRSSWKSSQMPTKTRHWEHQHLACTTFINGHLEPGFKRLSNGLKIWRAMECVTFSSESKIASMALSIASIFGSVHVATKPSWNAVLVNPENATSTWLNLWCNGCNDREREDLVRVLPFNIRSQSAHFNCYSTAVNVGSSSHTLHMCFQEAYNVLCIQVMLWGWKKCTSLAMDSQDRSCFSCPSQAFVVVEYLTFHCTIAFIKDSTADHRLFAQCDNVMFW